MIAPIKSLGNRTELTISDKIWFSSIAEALNSVFGSAVKNYQQVFFIPEIFHKLGLNQYHVWFPLSKNVKGNNEWENEYDGDILFQGLSSGKHDNYPEKGYERIVFWGDQSSFEKYRNYRFIGIFKFEKMFEGRQVWKRIDNKIKIYK